MILAKLSEIDCAYLAGFFDADGSIMASIEKHPEMKFGFRVRLSIKIAQKERHILDEIKHQLSWGHVRLSRGVHEYTIKDQQHVCAFVDLIYPFCRVKCRQLDLSRRIACAMERILSVNELMEVAQLADSLAECNVRSKNRRKNYTTKIQSNIDSAN